MPIIVRRIKSFLNEIEYTNEFSHTILHNYVRLLINILISFINRMYYITKNLLLMNNNKSILSHLIKSTIKVEK